MKKLVGVVALALSSFTYAAPVSVSMTYTGFYDVIAGAFDAHREVSLSFVGDDKDNDGIINLREIQEFHFDTIWVGPELCGQNDDYRNYSCLTKFNYEEGKKLEFSANRYMDYRTGYSLDSDVVSGEYFNSYGSPGFGNSSGPAHAYNYRWTNETRMSISAVPEPTMLNMLLIGFAGIAFALRRRA